MRAKCCSKYKLQYRDYYTIGEHNIVVDTHYNIEIIIIRRAQCCSRYTLQYRDYYTIGEHNIVVDAHYNIEIIIQ